NYTTTEKEALAIVFALKKWRFYLEGKRFKVETDHSALQSIFKIKEPSPRIARWIITLQQFDFEICHRPGNKMQMPDLLSRSNPLNLIEVNDIARLQREDMDLSIYFNYIENNLLPDDDKLKKK